MYSLTIKANSPEELKQKIKAMIRNVDGVKQEITGPKAVDLVGELVRKNRDQIAPTVAAQPSPLVQVPVFAPPAAPTVASSGPVELDARGIPWNEEVHASSKAKTKDGNWRAKRNVDENLLRQVEAQSQRPTQATFTPPPQPEAPKVQPLFPNQYANVASPQAPQYPPMPSSFHGQPAAPQFQAPPQQAPVQPVHSVPVQQTTPVAPVYDNFAPATRQAHDDKSWLETFNESIGKLVADGKINVDYLNQIKSHYNVRELWDLNDTQKIEIFHQLASYKLVHNVAGHA